MTLQSIFFWIHASGNVAGAGVLNIAVLVFREGLECVLVLAAITAGMNRDRSVSARPIMAGVTAGMMATLGTWVAAVRIMNDLSQSISALALQASTGLLAVAVLLVVMNWFFHKVYWTGWISIHNERKRELLARAATAQTTKMGLVAGLALLGFTSFYREGFEVVLFLQSDRLRLGNGPVFLGAGLGLVFATGMALLTFVAHRKLPHRRMLVFTGILLGIVLIVMVGEQVQEMQLAGWIPATTILALDHAIPNWMGMWLSIFPTVETLGAQCSAAGLVLGSYFVASRSRTKTARRENSIAGLHVHVS